MTRFGWAALWLLACNGPTEDASKDVDTSAETDADTDADSDSDTDADSDTDTVDADGDGFGVEVDCDDADPAVFPGAPDVCGDDRVTDCDRTSDDGLITVDGGPTFTDLGVALAAAADGSTVLLCPGNYAGATSTVSVELSAYGAADVTVIDGGQVGVALSLPGGSVTGLTVTGGTTTGTGGGIAQTAAAPLVITGCVVQGNRAGTGAGIGTFPGATVTIADTEVSGNEASGGGGGVWVGAGATVDLTGSTVSANSAYYGGGVHVDDGGSLTGGLVSANSSSQGDATTGYPGGGGGVSTFGTASVTGTEITGNQAWLGGGIGAAGPLTLTGVSVHDNQADAVGGGLFADASDVALDAASELRANTASDSGGGAYVVLGTFTGGTITGNQAGAGGGIYGYYADLYDVVVDGNSANDGAGVQASGPMLVSGGQITANVAAGAGGGIIISGSTVTFDGVLLADNRASLGGGLYLKGGGAVLTDCTVVRNDAHGAELQGSTLSSVTSDWGAAADDNAPGDVLDGASAFTGWGAAATFDCNDVGCSPAP